MKIYLVIAAILVAAELLYFRIADRFNIIDKPNERSYHTKIVIRGGGIIFSSVFGYGVHTLDSIIHGCWQR